MLSVTGTPKHAYISGETPMVSYVELHQQLENMRAQSRQLGDASQGALRGRGGAWVQRRGECVVVCWEELTRSPQGRV